MSLQPRQGCLLSWFSARVALADYEAMFYFILIRLISYE